MVENFLSGNYGAALASFDEVLAKGFNALHFVAALSTHFRNLVVARTAGLEALLELPDSLKKRYREQAAQCPLRFLYDALGITTACEAGYKSAVNPRLHIEFALMKLSFLTGTLEAAPAQAPKPVQTAPADKTAVAQKPAPREIPSPAAPEIPSPAPPVRNDSPAAIPPVIPAEAKESAPAEAKESAPADHRRRKPKTGSALSMNAIMEEKEEVRQDEAPAAVQAALPDDNTIRLEWKSLSQKYAARPRLANALAQSKLRIEEADGVKSVYFSVSNAAQKQWIEEKLLRELENMFRELVSSVKVNLHVDDVPDEEPAEKIPYMPEEKARDLMDKNPEVRAFVADLGLDTK
jgi:DNA polymerase-3 subunit gamma/tau